MKKNYIAPSMELVHVNPADIIATSDVTVMNETGDLFQLSRSGRSWEFLGNVDDDDFEF